jgi:hypothetical protein
MTERLCSNLCGAMSCSTCAEKHHEKCLKDTIRSKRTALKCKRNIVSEKPTPRTSPAHADALRHKGYALKLGLRRVYAGFQFGNRLIIRDDAAKQPLFCLRLT